MSEVAKTNQLPKVEDIVNDVVMSGEREVLNAIVNHEPPAKWLKEHPMNRNLKYLPIDKVEFLLRKIFKRFKIEVKEYKQVFNSVTCHVRVHYVDPISGEWDFQDGVAAVGVQLDAGSSGADMSKIKHDAVMKALPAAKSYAVKDAMENLGKIFGSDLNRKDTIPFEVDNRIIETVKSNKQKLNGN